MVLRREGKKTRSRPESQRCKSGDDEEWRLSFGSKFQGKNNDAIRKQRICDEILIL